MIKALEAKCKKLEAELNHYKLYYGHIARRTLEHGMQMTESTDNLDNQNKLNFILAFNVQTFTTFFAEKTNNKFGFSKEWEYYPEVIETVEEWNEFYHKNIKPVFDKEREAQSKKRPKTHTNDYYT